MRIFYLLLFFAFFPLNCKAAESQVVVGYSLYTVEESGNLCFYKRKEIRHSIEEGKIEKSLTDKNLGFLKAKMKDYSPPKLFSMYFFPDILQGQKKEFYYNYKDLCAGAVDPEEFPSEGKFRELFNAGKKELKQKLSKASRHDDNSFLAPVEITISYFLSVIHTYNKG